jgi:hypothetical protein
MTTLAGRPAELVARALPGPAASIVAKAPEAALARALDIALFSLCDQRFIGGRVVHSALASASGAVGGAFGLAALPIELPTLTAIMLRTIGEIARDEGEDLADPRTRLACLEVFALGHTGLAAPDGAEGGYFALRVLLARGLALAADTLVRKGPGIYLVALKAGRGWSTGELSAAITSITSSAPLCSSLSLRLCSRHGGQEPWWGSALS